MKKILMIVVVFSFLLAACGNQPTPAPQVFTGPDSVVAEGHLVPAQDLKLSFSVRGNVDEILVSEGQSVSKGDVLVRLADREQAEAALAAANLELTQAQQSYDDFVRMAPLSNAQTREDYMKAQLQRAEAERAWEKLDLSQIDDDIEDARAEVQDRQDDLKDAQETFDKYKDLNKDNSTRKDAEDDLEKAQEDYNEAVRKMEEIVRERDNARAVLDAALATEAEAKRKYELSMDGPDAEKLAVLSARLDNAKAQVAAAENNIANFELTAPFDGVVTDVNVTVGETVGAEKFAVQMADFSAWYVETSDLTELEVVSVAEGQSVTILPDALPDAELSGMVESISQSFKTQGGDVLYTVKIKLLDTDPALRWGMTVEVNFPAE